MNVVSNIIGGKEKKQTRRFRLQPGFLSLPKELSTHFDKTWGFFTQNLHPPTHSPMPTPGRDHLPAVNEDRPTLSPTVSALTHLRVIFIITPLFRVGYSVAVCSSCKPLCTGKCNYNLASALFQVWDALRFCVWGFTEIPAKTFFWISIRFRTKLRQAFRSKSQIWSFMYLAHYTSW